MAKDIVIINQSLGPFFKDIVNYLGDKGHRVTVIKGSKETFESEGDIRVIAGPEYCRHSILTRLLSWSNFLMFVFFRLWSIDKKNTVFVASNPPLLPHLVVFVGLFRKYRIVIKVWDIYPDVLKSRFKMRGLCLLVKIWAIGILFWVLGGPKRGMSKSEGKPKRVGCGTWKMRASNEAGHVM